MSRDAISLHSSSTIPASFTRKPRFRERIVFRPEHLILFAFVNVILLRDVHAQSDFGLRLQVFSFFFFFFSQRQRETIRDRKDRASDARIPTRKRSQRASRAAHDYFARLSRERFRHCATNTNERNTTRGARSSCRPILLDSRRDGNRLTRTSRAWHDKSLRPPSRKFDERQSPPRAQS